MGIHIPYRMVLIVAVGAVLGACRSASPLGELRDPQRVLQDPKNALPPVNPMVQSYRADLSAYTAVQVIMESYAGAERPHGYELTADTLRRELIDNLMAAGKFTVVEKETPGGKTLEARVRIQELSYVSGAARGTTGILAGRAVLNATLELRDKDSGDIVDTIRASHASSHAHGVFGATSGRQITAVAKEFASRIVAGKSTASGASTAAASAPSAETEAEVVFWESVRNSKDPADLRAYLEQYPNGKFAPLARNRLAKIQ
jgi:hypothetical protein